MSPQSGHEQRHAAPAPSMVPNRSGDAIVVYDAGGTITSLMGKHVYFQHKLAGMGAGTHYMVLLAQIGFTAQHIDQLHAYGQVAGGTQLPSARIMQNGMGAHGGVLMLYIPEPETLVEPSLHVHVDPHQMGQPQYHAPQPQYQPQPPAQQWPQQQYPAYQAHPYPQDPYGQQYQKPAQPQPIYPQYPQPGSQYQPQQPVWQPIPQGGYPYQAPQPMPQTAPQKDEDFFQAAIRSVLAEKQNEYASPRTAYQYGPTQEQQQAAQQAAAIQAAAEAIMRSQQMQQHIQQPSQQPMPQPAPQAYYAAPTPVYTPPTAPVPPPAQPAAPVHQAPVWPTSQAQEPAPLPAPVYAEPAPLIIETPAPEVYAQVSIKSEPLGKAGTLLGSLRQSFLVHEGSEATRTQFVWQHSNNDIMLMATVYIQAKHEQLKLATDLIKESLHMVVVVQGNTEADDIMTGLNKVYNSKIPTGSSLAQDAYVEVSVCIINHKLRVLDLAGTPYGSFFVRNGTVMGINQGRIAALAPQMVINRQELRCARFRLEELQGVYLLTTGSIVQGADVNAASKAHHQVSQMIEQVMKMDFAQQGEALSSHLSMLVGASKMAPLLAGFRPEA